MKINLKYFGMVTEIAAKNMEELLIEEGINSKDLCQSLEEKYKALTKIDYRIAVNENLIIDSIQLKENDIVAILPPFSGG